MGWGLTRHSGLTNFLVGSGSVGQALERVHVSFFVSRCRHILEGDLIGHSVLLVSLVMIVVPAAQDIQACSRVCSSRFLLQWSVSNTYRTF